MAKSILLRITSFLRSEWHSRGLGLDMGRVESGFRGVGLAYSGFGL
jgi:hypothetical protein